MMKAEPYPAGVVRASSRCVLLARDIGSITRQLRRLASDDAGQDLLEYALLTAFVGLAGLAALNAMGTSIGTWYGNSNTTVNGLWVSPDPGGS